MAFNAIKEPQKNSRYREKERELEIIINDDDNADIDQRGVS